MQDLDIGRDRERQPGPSSRKTSSWRDAYPVLLGCLSEGRNPSGEEIEHLVDRIGREIGTSQGSVWNRAGAADARRRLLVAAARTALLGRRDPLGASPQSPLVLRGH